MDSYDLELAFFERLITLTYNNLETYRPDEIIDLSKLAKNVSARRGTIVSPVPDFWYFGNGVGTRVAGTYQIDIWVPRGNYNALGDEAGALKQLKNMSDAHLAHFFPENGRGLTVTKNSTSAHITKRPSQTPMSREGSYLREMIEIEFFADILASA